jgi:hypothetical protein
MTLHPRPARTRYHRTHPVFMAYAYATAVAALWTIATVWRAIA